MWKLSRHLMQVYVNWHSSQAQEEASSAATFSAGKQFAQSNGHPTRQVYFFNDKTTADSHLSLFGMTCRPLTANAGEGVLTWFLEDFLARTSALPEQVPASPARAQDFGVRWRALFTRYNHDLHLWKTRPSLWDEGLTSSLPTLPRWGLMHDGALWERVTLARLTNEIESGSLPTPVAYDATATSPGNHYKGLGWRSKHDTAALVGDQRLTNGGESLTANSDVMTRKVWQTPVADDSVARKRGKFNSRGEPKLSGQVKQTWPTPTVTQIKINPEEVEGRMQRRPGDAAVPLIERLQRDEFTRHRVRYPTPLFADGRKATDATKPMQEKILAGEGQDSLRRMIRREEMFESGELQRPRQRLLPTPVAQEDEATRRFTVETSARHYEEGRQVHLSQIVRDPNLMAKAFPTPTSQNGLRSASGSDHYPNKWQHPGHPEYGELNPQWVEWLMGWPAGWTDLKPMSEASMEQWVNDNGETDRGGDQWGEDPSDEANGIGKTVPKSKTKREEDIRVGRISALGNGQVSAVAAAAFIHLWHLVPPAEIKD